MSDLPPWSVTQFISDLKTKENEGVDRAIDLAISVMNHFLLAVRTQEQSVATYALSEMQEFLDRFDPAAHDPSVTWAVLIQAWNGQRVGIVYQPFLAKVEDYMVSNQIFEKDGFNSRDQFKNIRGMTDGPTLGDIARSVGGNPNLF